MLLVTMRHAIELWRALDRGWKATILGLVIVAVHAAGAVIP